MLDKVMCGMRSHLDRKCTDCPYGGNKFCNVNRLFADALVLLRVYNDELRLRCTPKAMQAFDDGMFGLLKIVPVEYAHWVEEPDRERHWHCSNCSKVQGIASVAMKYCPECGAKMIEHPWAGSGCGQAFSAN